MRERTPTPPPGKESFQRLIERLKRRALEHVGALEFVEATRKYTTQLLPLGLLILVAVLFALSAFLIKTPWVRNASTMLAVAIPYFFVSAWTTAVVALLASILFAFSATYRIQQEIKLSFGFNFS